MPLEEMMLCSTPDSTGPLLMGIGTSSICIIQSPNFNIPPEDLLQKLKTQEDLIMQEEDAS